MKEVKVVRKKPEQTSQIAARIPTKDKILLEKFGFGNFNKGLNYALEIVRDDIIEELEDMKKEIKKSNKK